MGHFVDKKLVPVTDGMDTIWIVPKLSFGARNRVQDAGIKMQIAGAGGTTRTDFAVAAYTQELLCESIVSWSGPGWDGVECTRDAILALDYEDPLFVKVLEEVNRRNTTGGTSDPKLAPPPAPVSVSDGSNGSAVIDVSPIPQDVAA